jgi:hypothetical protein
LVLVAGRSEPALGAGESGAGKPESPQIGVLDGVRLGFAAMIALAGRKLRECSGAFLRLMNQLVEQHSPMADIADKVEMVRKKHFLPRQVGALRVAEARTDYLVERNLRQQLHVRWGSGDRVGSEHMHGQRKAPDQLGQRGSVHDLLLSRDFRTERVVPAIGAETARGLKVRDLASGKPSLRRRASDVDASTAYRDLVVTNVGFRVRGLWVRPLGEGACRSP